MNHIEQEDVQQLKSSQRRKARNERMSAAATNLLAIPTRPVLRIAPPGRWWRFPFARTVGVPRAALFLRLARHQGSLQADRDRRGLGRPSAVSDHAGLQPFLRQAGAHSFQGLPYPIFYYSALLPWMYFATRAAKRDERDGRKPARDHQGLFPAAGACRCRRCFPVWWISPFRF